jgi:hypothetical protein
MIRLLAILAILAPSVAIAQVGGGGVSGAPTTNSSATIVTGNTFQTVLSAGVRHSLTIENNNTTDSCWVFVGGGSATKGTSVLLLAGSAYTRYYPYVPNDAIQATCATTSDTLYVDTQ